jgi:hypothetical protein
LNGEQNKQAEPEAEQEAEKEAEKEPEKETAPPVEAKKEETGLLASLFPDPEVKKEENENMNKIDMIAFGKEMVMKRDHLLKNQKENQADINEFRRVVFETLEKIDLSNRSIQDQLNTAAPLESNSMVPGMSEYATPEGSEVNGVVDSREVPKEASDTYATPEASDAYATPEASDAYATPEASDAYATPEASDAYATPEASDTSAIPEASDVYASPEASDVVPQASETYASKDTPEANDAYSAPEPSDAYATHQEGVTEPVVPTPSSASIERISEVPSPISSEPSVANNTLPLPGSEKAPEKQAPLLSVSPEKPQTGGKRRKTRRRRSRRSARR